MGIMNYLIVAATFVIVAMIADVIIVALHWSDRSLALAVAAITASQVGVILWHKEFPQSSLLTVKVRLGILVTAVAVVFAVVLQNFNHWLENPEIAIPITAVGCFVLPFVIVGRLWNSLAEFKRRKEKKAN